MSDPTPEALAAALEAIERLRVLTDGCEYPKWDSRDPDNPDTDLATIHAALTAHRDRFKQAHALLRHWRYQTAECPGCGQAVHTADCVLLELLTLLDPMTP